MTRFIRHLALGVSSSVALYLGASGCTDTVNDIFIQQVLVPQASATTGGCSYLADPGQAGWLSGYLDLTFTSQYDAALLVGSQLVTRQSRNPLRPETSGINLLGTEVSIQNAAGDTIAGPFTVPGTGYIQPGASGFQYGAVGSTLIDTATGSKLRNQLQSSGKSLTRVTAHVKAFGTTLGGFNVESGEFVFPITVCIGCLVSFPPDANDLTQPPQPNCKSTVVANNTTSTCHLGQDVAVDCRICHILHPGDPACEPTTNGRVGVDAGTD